jgi:hypothetical protein
MINFWLDPWCGEPLALALDIPHHLHAFLKAKVSHFIENRNWKIPTCLVLAYPDIRTLTHKVTIPLQDKEDKLFWKHSHDGDLSLKESYSFHCNSGQIMHWTKFIWNVSIPPSKSIIAWRSLHHKLPTDANLALRGCHLPSMCSLCDAAIETTDHLFLSCRYVLNIWGWLGSCLNANCSFTSLDEALKLRISSWSPLYKLVVAAAMVNCVYFIWYARNQVRFNDKKIHWKSIINLIIATVSLSGNSSCLKAYSDISKFVLLQKFHVKMKFGTAPKIKEVIW